MTSDHSQGAPQQERRGLHLACWDWESSESRDPPPVTGARRAKDSQELLCPKMPVPRPGTGEGGIQRWTMGHHLQHLSRRKGDGTPKPPSSTRPVERRISSEAIIPAIHMDRKGRMGSKGSRAQLQGADPPPSPREMGELARAVSLVSDPLSQPAEGPDSTGGLTACAYRQETSQDTSGSQRLTPHSLALTHTIPDSASGTQKSWRGSQRKERGPRDPTCTARHSHCSEPISCLSFLWPDRNEEK